MASGYQQADAFHQAFTQASADADLSDLATATYPSPFPDLQIRQEHLTAALDRMQNSKAADPQGFTVPLIKKIWPIILPVFSAIVTAGMKCGHYPAPFKQSITLVLKKAKRPDYTAPSAWRPINLISRLGLIWDSALAARLSFLAEKEHLLPDQHFGGRPGRSANDALTSLTERTHHEWRRGRVLGLLSLDSKAAFPSMRNARLCHNLKMAGVPANFVAVIKSWHHNRHVRYSLSGHLCQPRHRRDGCPQGSSLSPLLSLFYNAPLISAISALVPEYTATGFIDDVGVLVSGTSPTEMRRSMQRVAPLTQRWQKLHGTLLDLNKTHYTLLSRNPWEDEKEPLQLDSQVIPWQPSVELLGVLLDNKLLFKAQRARALQRSQAAWMAITSLGNSARGISMSHILRLYKSIVLPKAQYATIVWHPFGANNHFVKRLQILQNSVLRRALGGFRTSPVDATHFDTGLPAIQTHLDSIVATQAAKLLTGSTFNPAAEAARRAFSRPTLRYKTPLMRIFTQDFFASVDLNTLEHISPAPAEPGWKGNIETVILPREDALELCASLSGSLFEQVWFTDGSRIGGRVGAAALNERTRHASKLHLGSDTHHTVYEAELQGILMALQASEQSNIPLFQITIAVDNQAAIQALGRPPRRQSGQHLILQIHAIIGAMRVNHKWCKVRIIWCPGHEGIQANEEVDRLAKEAAEGEDGVEAEIEVAISLAAVIEGVKNAVAGGRSKKDQNRKGGWFSQEDEEGKRENDNCAGPLPTVKSSHLGHIPGQVGTRPYKRILAPIRA
ncbi:hypothetical protein A4X13_0g8833 [Tilletia indica]|uniref:RNase H type-1 domain-containing protein n=1 Tax=Tilletia indica TaxID=43049 RepID=A0A177T065_9BASI|nr:hypothetical protein A4X13_0g8833 [Tilletia indica]